METCNTRERAGEHKNARSAQGQDHCPSLRYCSDSAFWDGSTWPLTPSPALHQERPRASRSVRGVGSVPPGHVSIRSRPCVRWPDPAAAILGVLAAASFVTRPRGTAWQGACGRGWVSPLPLGAQRELRLLELRNCQAAGWQGPQGPGHREGTSDLRNPGCPCSRHAGARPRPSPRPSTRLPARFPPLTSAPASRDSPLPLGCRAPLLAEPTWHRLCRHRKSFSRHGGPARRRRPERALGARPRAEPGGRAGRSAGARGRPRTRPRVAGQPSPASRSPGAIPDAGAFASGSSPSILCAS